MLGALLVAVVDNHVVWSCVQFGNSAAQHNLAFMYSLGLGVPKDDAMVIAMPRSLYCVSQLILLLLWFCFIRRCCTCSLLRRAAPRTPRWAWDTAT